MSNKLICTSLYLTKSLKHLRGILLEKMEALQDWKKSENKHCQEYGNNLSIGL